MRAEHNQLLQTELKLLHAEVARLRRRLNESGVLGRRLDRAYQDALLLAQFHVGFQSTTRQHAFDFAGITNNRWENAIALLKLARVHNGRRWSVHDLATIEEALAEAKANALDTPEAFHARLPKHARPPGD